PRRQAPQGVRHRERHRLPLREHALRGRSRQFQSAEADAPLNHEAHRSTRTTKITKFTKTEPQRSQGARSLCDLCGLCGSSVRRLEVQLTLTPRATTLFPFCVPLAEPAPPGASVRHVPPTQFVELSVTTAVAPTVNTSAGHTPERVPTIPL